MLACLACNEVKQDMTGREFRYFLRTGFLHEQYIAYLTERTRIRARARGIHITLVDTAGVTVSNGATTRGGNETDPGFSPHHQGDA